MKLILLGLSLLMGGMALTFLMVIDLLRPSFALSFLAYAASLVGLALGVSATVHYASPSTSLRTGFRRKERD